MGGLVAGTSLATAATGDPAVVQVPDGSSHETRFPSNWVVWILCSGHLGVPGGLPE
ncbi:hypothetical protein OG874_04430 [Nocardia sp. NBC_00565]|uniref:hypothetical protein n=1 Tax=Nocardia sp. NBC_00565 TaxID=2975993 RepID=UPI002E7FE8CC|nr:hypothetical protein [Nocardia sp. NBC_00565]WUC04456.1 hypothetical protein OG874_04430 [Nocardia sp. NBC_00565]